MPGSSPAMPIATIVASTELTTTSVKLRTLKRRRITSSAKKTPAIGALNEADTPPAAPPAMSRVIISGGCCRTRPRFEASDADTCATGPI